MKKRFWAVFAVILGMTGCQGDVETVQSYTEQTTQETQQTTTAEQTEQTYKEVEASETETSSESLDNAAETITIAGQEFSVDEEGVVLYLSDIENTTDVSELCKLNNLKSLQFVRVTDGNTPYITGFSSLENCDTLESISIQVGFENDNDIHVLETMPNLKSLDIYGAGAYDFWDFKLDSVENLSLIGTIDLSKIDHLTNLKSLYLEYNSNTDLTPIEKLTNLEGLSIWECDFTDYSSLLELKNLKELYICSVPMDENMYNKLIEELPNCKITVQEIQQTTTAELTEQTYEEVETSETETSSESLNNAAETITIAGQEFSVDATELFLWDMPVTDEDMQKLLNFKRLKNLSVDLLADGCEINDMNVLSQIKTLETLCINGTYNDLSFLNGMTGLKSLSLMHFNCDKLEKLPNNTALTEIDLDECSIDGLDWITDFPSLKKVSFNHVDVADLDPIGELKDLEILSVTFSAGRVIDFSFLQNLKKLKSLTFTPFPSSSVYDLDVLADCTALEELAISGTYKDLEFCRSLTNLKKFSIISDNHFVYDILPLTECVNLQELKLGCDFDSTQLDTLRNSLPDCTFVE